uniref:Putative secreted protein n=1 Tax=Anopheles marajoara TaxID=58244 RepID=A0A2M4C5V6_9DIPT
MMVVVVRMVMIVLVRWYGSARAGRRRRRRWHNHFRHERLHLGIVGRKSYHFVVRWRWFHGHHTVARIDGPIVTDEGRVGVCDARGGRSLVPVLSDRTMLEAAVHPAVVVPMERHNVVQIGTDLHHVHRSTGVRQLVLLGQPLCPGFLAFQDDDQQRPGQHQYQIEEDDHDE